MRDAIISVVLAAFPAADGDIMPQKERTLSWDETMTLTLWLTGAIPTEEKDVIKLLGSLSHEQYTQLYDAYESTK